MTRNAQENQWVHWGAMAVGFGVLLLIPLTYSSCLQQKEQSLRIAFRKQEAIQERRKDAQESLEHDIKRLNKITSDTAAALEDEEKQYRYQQETLQNIERKLKGAEELQRAVAQLREVYGTLRHEIEKGPGLR